MKTYLRPQRFFLRESEKEKDPAIAPEGNVSKKGRSNEKVRGKRKK